MTEPLPSAGVAKGNLLAGKRGLIMGLANNRSIAWGIARAAAAQGAELAFTYQGDALKKRVEPLAAELGSKIVLPCDVSMPAPWMPSSPSCSAIWGRLDFLVHCHRLLRQVRARRALRRHQREELHADDAGLLLLVHRARARAPRS